MDAPCNSPSPGVVVVSTAAAPESEKSDSCLPGLPTGSGIDTNNSTAQDVSSSNLTKRRLSSHEFSEQIRQLEIEGNKLRSTTQSALSQGTFGQYGFGIDLPLELSFQSKQVISPLTASLASLVDISAEQKTIAELRTQLENQRRETERLQSHLLTDTSVGRTFSAVTFSSPAKTAFSTLPWTDLSPLTSSRRAFEFVPPSHMERALKESQEQVVELRKKLQDAKEQTEQQKRQFHTNNEELKTKLHETILNRDIILELRQKESASQEALINKLQSSIAHLQEKYQAQEQALNELSKQADSSSQSSYTTSVALKQLRAVLADREHVRGRPYLETDPASASQNATALILTLEKCLQECDQEKERAQQKISQLEHDLERVQKMSYEKEQKLIKAHQDRLRTESEDALKKVSSITSEQETQLEEASQKATKARKQAALLQEQLHVLEQQHKQQVELKNETMCELETKLKQLKQEYTDDQCKWQEKRQALEMSLDEVQRELIQAKAEKLEAVHIQNTAESRAEDSQRLVTRLERDLETERERIHQQRQREEELRLKILSLEGHLTHKQQEVERLEKMLEVVKQEASVHMHDRVASIEKQERDRYTDQISILTSQLTSANEAKTKLTVDAERQRMGIESLQQQLSDMKLDLQAAQSQVNASRLENQHISQQLGNKHNECERLRQERDKYCCIMAEREEEVVQLRSTVERATLQLEEKEKVLSTVREQSTSISQLMEMNTRSSDNIRGEREQLVKLVESQSAALEELRASKEAMTKKLKLREKRVRELQDERLKLVEEMGVQSQEFSLAQQEKDNISAELKESRAEVSLVTDSRDKLKRDLIRLKASHAKELDKLHKRLKEAEQDSRLTQKVLKSKDSVDSKAVKVADKIQKEMTAKRNEMDNLRTKVRRLEEKVETLTKEKLMVERDKDNLKSALARSLLHTAQLTEELEASQALNSKWQKKNKDLEDALEKEAGRCASTQTQLEQFDQEMATLKLRHQLDLKEATQMALSNKISKVTWVPVNDKTGPGTLEPRQQTESNRNNNRLAGPSRTGKLGQKKGDNTSQMLQEIYSEAGKELKTLLEEMKFLIHDQQQRKQQRPDCQSNLDRRKRRSRSSSLDRQNISRVLEKNNSLLSMSYPLQSADITGCSAYTGNKSYPPSPGWLSGNRRRASQVDVTGGSVSLSYDHQSDITNFSSSFGSPAVSKVSVVPDTQELCRRLEEKIANLTRMGSSLQHENEEMAHLITAQAGKLQMVRKTEQEMANRR